MILTLNTCRNGCQKATYIKYHRLTITISVAAIVIRRGNDYLGPEKWSSSSPKIAIALHFSLAAVKSI